MCSQHYIMPMSKSNSRRNFFLKRGTRTLGEHRNPYVTVVAVWIVSAFGLASVISLPISSVLFYCALLSLVITVIGGLAYRAYRTDLKNRDLPAKLFSDLRRFIFD